MKTMEVRLLAPFIVLLIHGMSGWGATTPLPDTAIVSGVYPSVAITGVAHSSFRVPTAILVPGLTPIAASEPISTARQVLSAASFPNLLIHAGDCHQVTYVRDANIPDGTVLTPGEVFTKIWKLENTGDCPWNKSYSMTFVGGTAMDGIPTEIGRWVKSGKQINVSVSLIAPVDDGTYTGYWELTDRSGSAIGEEVYVQIVVSADAASFIP